MDEYRGENKIVLRGQAARAPVPSHRNHGVDYYLVPLRVPRLSGVDAGGVGERGGRGALL